MCLYSIKYIIVTQSDFDLIGNRLNSKYLLFTWSENIPKRRFTLIFIMILSFNTASPVLDFVRLICKLRGKLLYENLNLNIKQFRALLAQVLGIWTPSIYLSWGKPVLQNNQ